MSKFTDCTVMETYTSSNVKCICNGAWKKLTFGENLTCAAGISGHDLQQNDDATTARDIKHIIH